MVPVVLNEGCWALGFVLYTVAYGFIGDGHPRHRRLSNLQFDPEPVHGILL